MSAPTFTAGGLASGLDTNSIIENLVKIESLPITALQKRQTNLKTQVSLLGNISSKLSALASAAKTLKDNGALGVQLASTHTAFSAVPGSGAAAGRYQVQVTDLAYAAKARSASFDSPTAPVNGGTLHLEVQGTGYDVEIADGQSLADVAFAINQLGAPVGAAVLTTAGRSYLSITNRDTGFTIGGNAADALVISEVTTGSAGQSLAPPPPEGQGESPADWMVVTAANSHVLVDGLDFERRSNQVSDVIPGTTLSLAATMTASQDMVLANDPTATQKNLQAFVDAYNAVTSILQKQLAVGDSTDRQSTLAGDASVRSLQRSLQSLTSTEVPGLSTVRSLADLGIKTERDGTLTIKTDRLEKAIASNPNAVNQIFSQATTGLGVATQGLVTTYTTPKTGILASRTDGLAKSISQIDDNVVTMQTRLEAYRKSLLMRFTAMEQVVSGLKNIGNFLTQQAAAAQGSKG